MSRMRAATGLAVAKTRAAGGRDAAAEAARSALEGLDGLSCDLAVIFCSASLAQEAEDIGEAVVTTLVPKALIGVTGAAIVEKAREVEDQPVVAVWAAHLPETRLRTFDVGFAQTEEGRGFVGSVPSGEAMILFADPFTFPADLFVRAIDEQATEANLIVGGLASGGNGAGTHRLWRDDAVVTHGAVGVVLDGRVKVAALVSQGCRPIGEPRTVTRASRTVVQELAGKPPLEHIRELLMNASPQERGLVQHGLHIGRVVDEYKTEFERGDFLIRNLMGVDNDTGAVAVGDLIEVGETIQFHVRDAATADEDLRAAAAATPQPDAAMLFTCTGRGSHLFGVPDHDAGVLSGAWDGVALAGFSCSGEIGPVGGKTFLHGFTASVALFYDSQA